MNKDKLVSLIKYQAQLRDKLLSPIPFKHKDRIAVYKQFLNNELPIVTAQIEAAKLENVK